MRFILLDRITDWHPGERARGVKAVSLTEDFFADHFPRHPVMPGVLIVEALAQLSGLLLEATLKEKHGLRGAAILAIVERARFRRFVSPGDLLDLEVRILSCHPEGAKVEAAARVGDALAVEARLVFAHVEATPERVDPALERMRDELMRQWRPGREPNGAPHA